MTTRTGESPNSLCSQLKYHEDIEGELFRGMWEEERAERSKTARTLDNISTKTAMALDQISIGLKATVEKLEDLAKDVKGLNSRVVVLETKADDGRWYAGKFAIFASGIVGGATLFILERLIK